MLRLTLDLLPEGNARRARMLGRVDIYNSGEGSEALDCYVAELHEADRTSHRASLGLLNRRATMPWSLVTRGLWALGYAPPEPTDRAVLASMIARLPEIIERERSRIEAAIGRHFGGSRAAPPDDDFPFGANVPDPDAAPDSGDADDDDLSV